MGKKGTFLDTVQCQLINVEGMIELKGSNYYFRQDL